MHSRFASFYARDSRHIFLFINFAYRTFQAYIDSMKEKGVRYGYAANYKMYSIHKEISGCFLNKLLKD